MSSWAASSRKSAEYARKSLEEIAEASRPPANPKPAPSYEPAYSRYRNRPPTSIGQLNSPTMSQKRWLSTFPHGAMMAPFFRSNFRGNFRRANRVSTVSRMSKSRSRSFTHCDIATFEAEFFDRFGYKLDADFHEKFAQFFQHFERKFSRAFAQRFEPGSAGRFGRFGGRSGRRSRDPFEVSYLRMYRRMRCIQVSRTIKAKMRSLVSSPSRGSRKMAHTACSTSTGPKHEVSCPLVANFRRFSPASTHFLSGNRVDMSRQPVQRPSSLRERALVGVQRPDSRPYELIRTASTPTVALKAYTRERMPRTELNRQIRNESSSSPTYRAVQSSNRWVTADQPDSNEHLPFFANNTGLDPVQSGPSLVSNECPELSIEETESWSELNPPYAHAEAPTQASMGAMLSDEVSRATPAAFEVPEAPASSTTSIPSRILSHDDPPLRHVPSSSATDSVSTADSASTAIFSAAVDFNLSPHMSMLPFVSQLTEETVASIQDVVQSHITHLRAVLADVTRSSEFGESPVSVENGTTSRIHFPNSDVDRVNVLVSDKDSTRGTVVEVSSPAMHNDFSSAELDTLSEVSSGISTETQSDSVGSADEVWTTVVNNAPPLTFDESLETSETEPSSLTMN